MQRILKLLVGGGGTGLNLPETLLRCINYLTSNQVLSASGWNVGAGLLVARTGATVTVVVANGRTVRLAVNSSAPALTGLVLTTGQHAAVVTTCDASGTLRNYFSSIELTAADIKYPLIPENEVVIGIVHFAPTTTFTGGTTALDAANINAAFSSPVGPFPPTNTI